MFLRRNSSEKPARRKLLESLQRRLRFGAAALAVMLVSAAAAAGHAWLVGPLLQNLETDSGAQMPPGMLASPGLSANEIVWLLALVGLLRALPETRRTNLSAKLQLHIISEFQGKYSGMCCASSLLHCPRGACLPHPGRSGWLADPAPFGCSPGHPEQLSGYCTSHCSPEGGCCTSHPEDFLPPEDRVLEVRDGTVIEWERRTADALLH